MDKEFRGGGGGGVCVCVCVCVCVLCVCVCVCALVYLCEFVHVCMLCMYVSTLCCHFVVRHHSPAAVVLALMNAVGPAPALVLALTPIV